MKRLDIQLAKNGFVAQPYHDHTIAPAPSVFLKAEALSDFVLAWATSTEKVPEETETLPTDPFFEERDDPEELFP